MSITFKDILYDGSLKKPKDSCDIKDEMSSYEGINELMNLLKDEFGDVQRNGGKIIVNKKHYAIRYCGEKSNGYGFSMVKDSEVQGIFAIKSFGKDSFRVACVNMDFVKNKLQSSKRVNRESGEWSLTESEEKQYELVQGPISSKDVNEAIYIKIRETMGV